MGDEVSANFNEDYEVGTLVLVNGVYYTKGNPSISPYVWERTKGSSAWFAWAELLDIILHTGGVYKVREPGVDGWVRVNLVKGIQWHEPEPADLAAQLDALAHQEQDTPEIPEGTVFWWRDVSDLLSKHIVRVLRFVGGEWVQLSAPPKSAVYTPAMSPVPTSKILQYIRASDRGNWGIIEP